MCSVPEISPMKHLSKEKKRDSDDVRMQNLTNFQAYSKRDIFLQQDMIKACGADYLKFGKSFWAIFWKVPLGYNYKKWFFIRWKMWRKRFINQNEIFNSQNYEVNTLMIFIDQMINQFSRIIWFNLEINEKNCNGMDARLPSILTKSRLIDWEQWPHFRSNELWIWSIS